jgi:hypothetical protein
VIQNSDAKWTYQTSNQVMQEIQAYKVAVQNVEDARARALGM